MLRRWNRRHLTDTFLFHVGTCGLGSTTEEGNFTDPPSKRKQEKEAQATPEHKQECARAVRLSRPEE